MKRTYIKPAVEILDIETKATFMVVSWKVDDGKKPGDHGYSIEDEDGNYPDNYDAWDSKNW